MTGIVRKTKCGISHIVDMEIQAEEQVFIAGRERLLKRRF